MSPEKMAHSALDLNPEFKKALGIMENTGQSVFVIGRTGTGKSTLLTYFRRHTAKKVAVLAPTGVAALNVQGQTIHSFFWFKPNVTLEKVRKVRFRDENGNIYRKLDAIVIDEVSMVRADILDCVDKYLRLNGPRTDRPFGGIQMIFIGDLYQLPPVVTGAERKAFDSLYQTPYFFSARVFAHLQIELVELQKVYRQRDEAFISLLNSIRSNSVTPQGLEVLNQRCLPDFEPALDEFYIYLTTTNDLAGRVNSSRLAMLRAAAHTFTAVIEGDFGKEYLPTSIELQVKVGAQVMMLNNDAAERWVNGSIGKVTGVFQRESKDVVNVELSSGETVEVTPHTWEIFRLFTDGSGLKSEVIGRFTQYPIMLAWAVTIHKSQGKTFNRVIIDIGGGAFAHGQVYVALSRCTTLAGIVLKRPLSKTHMWIDFRIAKFLAGLRCAHAERAFPPGDKVAMIRNAIENKASLRIVLPQTGR